MPRKGNDDLYRLIHLMSKTEKAYFKKFAERHVIGEKNNYLRLFDAMERQEVYDEKKLLKEERYIRQLPYLKNYLMENILRAMQVFYAGQTEEHRIRRMMDNAWFFFNKGMYENCDELLAKIRKTAAGTLAATLFADAVRMEERVVAHTGNTKNHVACLEQSLPAEAELLNDLLLYNAITSCYLKIHLYARTVSPRPDEKEKAQLKKEIEKPLQTLGRKAKSFRCRSRLYSTWAIYYSLLGEYDRYYENNKKLVTLYRSSPAFIRDNIIQYIGTLNNYGTSCITMKKYREALQVKDEIWRIDARQPEEKKKVFVTAVLLELNIHQMGGNHEEATKTFNRYREGLEQHLVAVNFQRYYVLAIYAIISCCYTGRYKEGLRLVSQLLTYPASAKHKVHLRLLNMLEVICLYELKHDITSFVKNIRRRLKADPVPAAAEIIFLDYLEKSWRLEHSRERIAPAQETSKRLRALGDDFSLYIFATYFDIFAWLESHITGEPFPEIIKRSNHDSGRAPKK